jgi:hypothetical protein
MSGVLSAERVDSLRILADAVDSRIATVQRELSAALHDQRSLRTAIMALQHELDGETKKGGDAP